MRKVIIIIILLLTVILTKAQVSHVTITCYQPVVKQCDKQPLITASGHRIDLKKLAKGHIKWCAISRDLLYLFPIDSLIYIEGFGNYIVKDIMHKRMRHKVDILIHPKNRKRVYATNVKIKKLK